MRALAKTVILSLILLLPGARPAFADTPMAALQTSIDKIISLLKNPAYKQEDQKPKMRQELLAAIDGIFDSTELSRRALGQNWKDFSPEQQKRFTTAFTRLLQLTYLDKIESYTDEKVSYLSEEPLGEGKAEVKTSILHQGKEIPLTYRMIDNGGWRVYDVVIEGVSLVQNYRQQFADLLMRGTPDELIDKISKKS